MFLERPRLDDRIRAALDGGLVTLQAPLGYGKTVALRTALRGAEMPVAWYDTAPWHEDAFVAPLIEAMAAVRPGFGRRVIAVAESGATTHGLAAAFAQDIAHLAAPVVLVVDDAAGLYDTPAFAHFVASLIAQRPEQLRLAIATRSTALIDATVTAADLRFTRDEVARALPVGRADDADRIARATDGWPAALALALHDSAPTISLGARAVERLDDAQRSLAERVAVAAAIDPDDFDAPDRAMLNVLIDSGLLLRSDDGHLELQPLVRAGLLDTMRARDDGSLERAHADASSRSLRRGALGAALFHLDASHDTAALIAFLARHIESVAIAGDLPLAARIVERLRRDGVDEPALFLFVDALREHARGTERAGPLFERATQAAAERGPTTLAFAASARGAEFALAHGRRLDAAQTAALTASSRDLGPDARSTAAVLEAWQRAIDGDFDGALEVAERAVGTEDARAETGLTIVSAYAETSLGRIASAQDRLDRLIQALEGSDRMLLSVQASIWYARLALLWGDTAAALDFAQQAQRVAARLEIETETASLCAALTEASAHAGDADATLLWAQELRRHAQTAWYAVDQQRLSAIADQHVARALFLRGAPTEARDLAIGAASDAPSIQRFALLADAAAYAVAAGEKSVMPAEIPSALLPNDAADAVALASAAALIETLAIVAGEAPPGRSADTSLYAALLRQRDGSVRLPMVGATLRKAIDGSEAPAALASSLALYCRRGPRFEAALLRALAQRLKPAAIAAPKAVLPEPLTDREHEVLTLLAIGLTNKEIAERLSVSPRTVETHVERVLGKLGVGSRTRAIATAIRLNLVTFGDVI